MRPEAYPRPTAMVEGTPSLAAAARGLRDGTLTAVSLARDALARIAATDPVIRAFVRLDPTAALAHAARADAELAGGHDRGPLHGIPTAIKDIFDVAGWPTTCNSRTRPDTPAAEDAAVVARLRAGGAVILGKLETYEFALGGPTQEARFPPARNPRDPGRIPGGSSSGSAAAVAAGMIRMAPGSCTAGSIRGPAAWCGIVGLKPTLGRVSCRGAFPLAPTLDHVGPLAWSVEDAAIALGVMAGHDPRDEASVDRPVPDYRARLGDGVEALRIGVPRHFFAASPLLAPEARDAIEAAIDYLRAAGATVTDVTLPDYDLFLAVNRVIMTAEALAIHAPALRRGPRGFAPITARRFAAGVAISAADYLDALRLRRDLTAALDGVMQGADLLLTAISLDVAPVAAVGAEPTAWPLQASPFNVTGHPAMSVPAGFGRGGMPLAVQIVGRPFDEETVLRAGHVLERAFARDETKEKNEETSA
ncbi:amidase [Muricoccus radiodurans]|uniref:amidase n=1 Tax=Muricoccus radiodurans TaxID=2231721 RepID=UPI003CF21839